MWISELFIIHFLIWKYKQLDVKIYIHFSHRDSFFLEPQLRRQDNVTELTNIH